jgi:hypothetical protein
MPINFNSLPNSNPGALPEKGTYYATIKKAEMKAAKTAGKPDYLNLQLGLTKPDGKGAGTIFDIIAESENEIARYKIQRFITALQVPITGTFELKDLVKIVQNKQLIVDITIQESKDGYPAKAIVDVFSGQIYYPMSDAAQLFGAETSPVIHADDAEDTTPPQDDTEY